MCNYSSRSGCGCCGCSICDILKNLFAVNSCGTGSTHGGCGCSGGNRESGFGSCSAQCCCTEAYYARQYGLQNANASGGCCRCRTCVSYDPCPSCCGGSAEF